MPNIQNGGLLVSQDLKNSANNSYYFGTQHAGEVVEVELNFSSMNSQTQELEINSIRIEVSIDESGFINLNTNDINRYLSRGIYSDVLDVSDVSSLEIYSGNSTVETLLTTPEVLLEDSFENIRASRGRGVYEGEVEGDNGIIWSSTNGIEAQNGIIASSSDGNTHIELDANENTTMTTIVDLNGSSSYVLSFDVNPRTGGSSTDYKDTSDMEISFGDAIVAVNSDVDGNLSINGENDDVTVVLDTQDNGWTKVTITYDNVDANSVDLSLSGTGVSDDIGMLVDNIKVVSVAQPVETTPVQEDNSSDDTPPAEDTQSTQENNTSNDTPSTQDTSATQEDESEMEYGRDSDNYIGTVTYDNDENCPIDDGRDVDLYLATDEQDRIDGGDGNDKILFRDSDVGVTVNLDNNANVDGDANTDEYVNFEGVTGSLHDDNITGDSGANTLQGGEGDDIVNGGAGSDWIVETTDNGNDTIDGGDGDHDTVAYYVHGDVNVNLETGENNQGDTLINVENLSGQFGNDTLVGDEKDNVLKGNEGNDTLIGGAGDDIIAGGADNDTIDGGEGEDKIILNGYPDDYEFTQNADGSVTVKDLRVGDANLDGTDTLVGVEKVEFQYKDDSCVNHFDIVDIDDAIDGNIDVNLGEITYSIDGIAQFANAVGFYKPNDDGTPELGKLLVDDQHTLSDGDHLAFVTPNDYCFFIIANGAGEISKDSQITFDNSGNLPILLVDGVAVNSPVYFSNPELNLGGRDHFQLELDGNGGTTIKIEDLDLGDADFDDVVMHTDFEMTDFGYDPINVIGGTDGNDWINSTVGDDAIDGGDGVDTVAYATNSDMNINLQTGTATGHGEDKLSNIENIATGGGDDTIVGNDANNRITTNGGDDTISAGDGNDIIFAGGGNDTIDGGADIDKIILKGEPTDFEFVLNENGTVSVTDLRDSSVDTLTSIENVEFRYTDDSGKNHFDNMSMADALSNYAPEGESYTYVNDGNVGNPNDWINSTSADDTIDGGDGVDTVAYATNNSINANLQTGNVYGHGDDKLANIENIATGGGSDTIIGSSGDNRIITNGGDDTISAGDGNDIINAGGGDDTIDGGADIDKVILKGEATDFEFVLNENGTVSVTDLRDSSVDTLTSIEDVEFRYTDGDGVNQFDIMSMADALMNYAPEGESYTYVNDGNVGGADDTSDNGDYSYGDDSYGDDTYGDDPEANDDSFTATEDGVEFIDSEDELDDGLNASGNVLGNDTGDGLQVTLIEFDNNIIDIPADGSDISIYSDYGTLTINSSGEFNFVVDNSNEIVDALNVGDSVVDGFKYTISDGEHTPVEAELNITIDGRDDAPVINSIEANNQAIHTINNVMDVNGDGIPDYISPEEFLNGDGASGIQFDENNGSVTINMGNANSSMSVDYHGGNAGYKNVLGFYEKDGDGNITDVKVLYADGGNDDGIGGNYDSFLGENSINLGTLNDLNGEVGFFIIPNGNNGDIRDAIENGYEVSIDGDNHIVFTNPNDANDTVSSNKAYYTDNDMSTDGRDHAIVTVNPNGGLTIGMEDLPENSSDQDYDDVVFTIKPCDTLGDGNTILNNIDISDVDNANLESATVTLTNFKDGDTINANGLPDGITATITDGVVELSGSATVEDYTNALESLTFESSSEDRGVREFEFTLFDGAKHSNTMEVSVDIGGCQINTFVQPEPVVEDVNVITCEDTTYTFTLDDFKSDANEVTIESLPTDGIIYLGDEAVTSNITVSASDINAGMLTFVADENESGRDEYNVDGVGDQQNDYAEFTFRIDDYSNTSTMSIDVTPIADSANLSVEGTIQVSDVITSINSSNVTDTSNGYSVSAFSADGTQSDISTIIGTSHDGFGVQSSSRPDGANPGAVTEINYYEGVGSEYVAISFDEDVATTNVSFAWKHSYGNVGGHQGETAVIEFYKDGNLLETVTHNGGSDRVDGPFTFQTSNGEAFDEMRFSSLSLGDDYIIHDVSYELATTTSSEELSIDAGNSIDLNISSSLIDTDGSETITNLFVKDLADGMSLTDGINVFNATDDNSSVDVLSWNLDSLVLNTADGMVAGDYNLNIVATTQESLADNVDANGENCPLTKDTEVSFKVVVTDVEFVPTVLLEESFENLQSSQGWHVEHGDNNMVTGDHGVVWDTHGIGVEVQSQIVSASSDGDTHAELDAHGNQSNVHMTTDVALTDVANYTMSFDVKPRDGGANRGYKDTSDMDISLDGRVVSVDSDRDGNLTINSDAPNTNITTEELPNGWTRVVVEYIGLDGDSSELVIDGTGAEDTFGMLLDNIKLSESSDQDTQPVEVVEPIDTNGLILTDLGGDGTEITFKITGDHYDPNNVQDVGAGSPDYQIFVNGELFVDANGQDRFKVNANRDYVDDDGVRHSDADNYELVTLRVDGDISNVGMKFVNDAWDGTNDNDGDGIIGEDRNLVIDEVTIGGTIDEHGVIDGGVTLQAEDTTTTTYIASNGNDVSGRETMPWSGTMTFNLPVADVEPEVIVSEDFENGSNGWNYATDSGEGNVTNFLGRFGGSDGEEAVSKTYDFGVENAGKVVTIDFDMYEIDSWDDENFNVFVNGEEVSSDTLSHFGRTWSNIATDEQDGGSELDAVGSNGQYWLDNDEAHHHTIEATVDENGELQLGFGSTLNQHIGDESYGIDNIYITASSDWDYAIVDADTDVLNFDNIDDNTPDDVDTPNDVDENHDDLLSDDERLLDGEEEPENADEPDVGGDVCDNMGCDVDPACGIDLPDLPDDDIPVVDVI